jgi:GSH-dependent disulfide-bond oxidoreductase
LSIQCRVALHEKAVSWRSRYVDLLAFDQLPPEYLTINTKGVVPTLVDNSQPTRASLVINEYIDAAFEGPKLTPTDPVKTARMREVAYTCEKGSRRS